MKIKLNMPEAFAVVPEQQEAITYVGATHVEACFKCHGTGIYTSISGRPLGECFACKGAGKKEFKTSTEEREQRKSRDDAKAQSRRDAFATEHSAEWAWIEANRSSFDFAQSMYTSVGAYGNLTERQMDAVRRGVQRSIDKLKAGTTENKVIGTDILMPALQAAFDRARAAGLSKPRLYIGAFTFKPAPTSGNNPGSIYVTHQNQYLGRIADGKLLPTRTCTEEQQAEIVEISKDPKAAAIAYGKKFGLCAICHRDLTDEESVARGIGPVCAGRMGW